MATSLVDQLNCPAVARPTALDAFKLARRTFLNGDRVDMGALASELNISRMTLNRWVGSRDALLCEIVWSVTRPTLDAARERAMGTGPEQVIDTIGGFVETLLASSAWRGFVQREPEIALRICTTTRTDFQERLRNYTRDLIVELLTDESLALPPDDLAYVIVRLAESYAYLDVITGGHPDAEKGRAAIGALLRGAQTRPGSPT